MEGREGGKVCVDRGEMAVNGGRGGREGTG